MSSFKKAVFEFLSKLPWLRYRIVWSYEFRYGMPETTRYTGVHFESQWHRQKRFQAMTAAQRVEKVQ